MGVWFSPAIMCSSFPKHNNVISTKQKQAKKQQTNQKIAVQTKMSTGLKAVQNQPLILLLYPVIHGHNY